MVLLGKAMMVLGQAVMVLLRAMVQCWKPEVRDVYVRVHMQIHPVHCIRTLMVQQEWLRSFVKMCEDLATLISKAEQVSVFKAVRLAVLMQHLKSGLQC